MMKKLIVFVCVATAMSTALRSVAEAADPDLVGWWKLDEGTGTVAMDSSGQGRHGTFVGSPEWVTGKLGGALRFDGQGGQRVDLGSFDVPAPGLTITCWLYAENLDTPGNDPRIISKATGGDGNQHWWKVGSGRIGTNKFLRFRLKTTQNATTAELKAGALPVKEWIHCAAWWDGTNMRIYKNGEQAGQLAKGGAAVASDPSVGVAIGNQPVGAENRPWHGTIDDVRIYRKALTVAEIATVMEGKDALSPLATGPSPKDGATIGATWANLEWTPGAWAVSHNLYVGTNFDDVNDGVAGTLVASTGLSFQMVGFPGLPFPQGLQPDTTYYWRVEEVNPSHPDSPWKGVVWSFHVAPKQAYRPMPPDTMKFVDPGVELSWTAGWGSIMYTVYFGKDRDAVAQATGGPTQTAQTFKPGALEQSTTYYWRVDSFDGTDWRTGDVWSFTTTRPGGGLRGEYAHYTGSVPDPPESAFQNIVLTRIDPGIDFRWGNGSPAPGVVNADNFAVRWTGEIEVPLTGRYTFSATTDDGVLLWVNGQDMARAWRTQDVLEQSGTIELVAGEFAAIEMLYFAATGNATAELRWQHEFIPKQIIPAAAFSPPVRASTPRPPDRSVHVPQEPELAWNTGQAARQHDVYFGDDRDAVARATVATAGIYQGRQNEARFLPGPLEWNKTYYWRVDEVNEAHPQSPWIGSVWSFTTADFLVVDDMEAYTDDEGSRIYETWIDGWTNNTGSVVGNLVAPFAERTIIHGGRQSMPLDYDNAKAPFYSEAEREFSPVQDWTVQGVDTLVLFFRGAAANGAGKLYAAVEDSTGKVAAVTNDSALTATTWAEWKVPLSRFAGVNLRRVKVLYLGVGDRNAPAPGGTGRLYIDDIRVTRSAP